MTTDWAIPRRSTILVTGGTGFIGMHCINVLLEHGYRVKALVRSQKKGELLRRCFPSKYSGRVTYGLIRDITDYRYLVREIKGCSGVIHLASPYTYDVRNFVTELMEPAIEGTKAVLEAAMAEPLVKRIVITSSFAAVFDATKGSQPGVVLTEKDFSPLSYSDGANTVDPAVAYRASKIVAEKEAWKFIRERRPHFDISVICPPMVYGPLVSTKLLDSTDDLNFSNSTIWKLANLGPNAEVPVTKGPVYVDVRDLAEAHYKALTVPEASNQRFMVSAGDFCNQEICDELRRYLPREFSKRVPIGNPGSRISGTHFTTDSSKAISVLGVSFRPIKDAVVDLVRQIYQYEHEF